MQRSTYTIQLSWHPNILVEVSLNETVPPGNTAPKTRSNVPNVSDLAAEILKADISKPGAIKKKMICMVSRCRCAGNNIMLLTKAFRKKFIIPNFEEMTQNIDRMYDSAQQQESGQVRRRLTRPPICGLARSLW